MTLAIMAILTASQVSGAILIGIALGFIAHAILKPATGRAGELHPLGYAFAVLFVLRYAFL